jgi:molybdenum cofactor biosynthesis protein B
MAVLTVSDTRTAENDTSGDYLVGALSEAGHELAARDLLVDDRYLIRARVAAWIADGAIEVVLVTGGTGFRARDVTPEAVQPLLDRLIPGFGELFRAVSAEEIGTSTIQSRAVAGLANGTFVACLPGSTGACRTAWTRVLAEQLDATHRPCNFVELLGT